MKDPVSLSVPHLTELFLISRNLKICRSVQLIQAFLLWINEDRLLKLLGSDCVHSDKPADSDKFRSSAALLSSIAFSRGNKKLLTKMYILSISFLVWGAGTKFPTDFEAQKLRKGRSGGWQDIQPTDRRVKRKITSSNLLSLPALDVAGGCGMLNSFFLPSF